MQKEHFVETGEGFWSDEKNIISYFRKRGVRWTLQRQLVLDTLRQGSGHMSIEEIHQQLKETFPRFEISTVYRTLELLCEMGVVVEVASRQDKLKRFELVGKTPHHHLHCEACGGEISFESELIEQLKLEALKRYHFTLRLEHFVGYGLCGGCNENARTIG